MVVDCASSRSFFMPFFSGQQSAGHEPSEQEAAATASSSAFAIDGMASMAIMARATVPSAAAKQYPRFICTPFQVLFQVSQNSSKGAGHTRPAPVVDRRLV